MPPTNLKPTCNSFDAIALLTVALLCRQTAIVAKEQCGCLHWTCYQWPLCPKNVEPVGIGT